MNYNESAPVLGRAQVWRFNCKLHGELGGIATVAAPSEPCPNFGKFGNFNQLNGRGGGALPGRIRLMAWLAGMRKCCGRGRVHAPFTAAIDASEHDGSGRHTSRANGLAPDDPNQHEAHDGTDQTDAAQHVVRRLHDRGKRAFGRAGKRREDQSLDDENQPQRRQEFRHLDYRGVVGFVRGVSLGLPEGSEKNRKKSESGLITSRVSAERSPAS